MRLARKTSAKKAEWAMVGRKAGAEWEGVVMNKEQEARSKKQEAVFVLFITLGKGKTSGVVEEWKE